MQNWNTLKRNAESVGWAPPLQSLLCGPFMQERKRENRSMIVFPSLLCWLLGGGVGCLLYGKASHCHVLAWSVLDYTRLTLQKNLLLYIQVKLDHYFLYHRFLTSSWYMVSDFFSASHKLCLHFNRKKIISTTKSAVFSKKTSTTLECQADNVFP